MPRALNMRSGYAGAAAMNLCHSDRARATSPLHPSTHESHRPSGRTISAQCIHISEAGILCYHSDACAAAASCLCLLNSLAGC